MVWCMGGKYGEGYRCATHITKVFVKKNDSIFAVKVWYCFKPTP